MIVKELTFTTDADARNDAEYRLSALLDNISRAERRTNVEEFDRLQADRSRIINTLADFSDLLDNTARTMAPVHSSLADQLPSLHDYIQRRRSNLLECMEAAHEIRDRELAQLDELRSRVTPARMAVARAKPPQTITLTADKLRKQLAAATGAKNLRLAEGPGRYDQRIEAVFDDIVLTPTDVTMPFWVKCINGTAPSVRIPPVKVAVHVTRGHIFLKRIRNVQGYIRGMGGYPVAHPHVTSSNGNPCLGDWGGPLMEAISSQDWELTFDIIKQFLRSAAHNDPAGKHWVNYVPSYGPDWRFNHMGTLDAWRYYSAEAPAVQTFDGTRKYAYLLFTGNGNYQWFLHDKCNEWPDITIKTIDAPPATIITEMPEDQAVEENDADDEYDESERDADGYDPDGYDRDGYDRDGYDDRGYDRNDYDRDGYDEEGYDYSGYDREGYDRDGRDQDGYNRDGYNPTLRTQRDAA